MPAIGFRTRNRGASAGKFRPFAAADYLLWLIPGIFFLLFESIGMMVIRLDGSPKYAMLCNVIPSVINIVLDWYFSYVLRFCWDLQGFFVNIWRQIRVGSSAVVTPKSW